MQWVLSSHSDASVEDNWPPKFQSFEEYKAELQEAVTKHPPFGTWLRDCRTIEHIISHNSMNGAIPGREMWDMPVETLKEIYTAKSTTRIRVKNAKRAFVEMYLDDNNATYAHEKLQHESKMEAYTEALKTFEQAQTHGYARYGSRPTPPRKSFKLDEHDRLQDELSKLVDGHASAAP